MGRREELEAKLIENPKDREARVVYADVLQAAGDPRGELIMLQHKQPDEVEEFFEAHAEALLGPLARYQTTFDGSSEQAFEWYLGFIRSAKLGYDSNSAGDVEIEDGPDIALEVGLTELLRHPSGMLLEQLVVTINMLDDGSYFDPIVKAIAATGSPCLRKLRLGEFVNAGGPGGAETSDYDYEMSWTSLGDASGMWSKLPRLEELVLQVGLGGSSASSTTDTIGAFDLPKLRRLEVVTGGMSEDCMRSFANAKLPEATYIDLWFGSANYGAGGTAQDLAPLLAGADVPKLTHLGLMNSEITDSICEALASSQILPRLTELSLAYGTMTDDGARALVASPALGKLAVLDVRANCLTPAGVSLLRASCPSVLADDQKSADERYVSLSE